MSEYVDITDAKSEAKRQIHSREIQKYCIEKMTLPRKWPVNARILRRIKKTVEPKETETYLTNRNPRNLEFLRIALKPEGYKLDNPGRSFWNK